jgi:hypothetical protein
MTNKDRIIIKIYESKAIESYCRTLHNDYEELKSQLIYQLIKMPEVKMVTAETNGYLEYLCFTICKRILYGNVKDSGIFYLNKKHLSLEEGYGYNIIDDSTDDDNTLRNLDIVNEIVNNQHWYSKILFNYHYKDGYKLREIAEMTGINIKSVAYTIRKTRDEIKKQIKDDRNSN